MHHIWDHGYMHHGYMHHGYMHHGYMHHEYMHHGCMHHLYIHHIMDTCIMDTSAWVTRPERPKGAKDEVKVVQRAKRRPEGPQTRSWAPKLLVSSIML